ncbi:hypothetical protein AUJ46_06660 [Candidatus Peregrinibacteria bacterium CG1_02_54_53]|nr:MAG: hypothetical protein AUJ46_06660 [Candidatus Peregrinibacteria bacterium CG1_02_54_53]
MEKAGIQYFRYMDDVRIFAFDRPGLKRNMITLVRALRELKLNLNAKKTSIYEIEDYAKLKGVVDPKRDLLSKIDNIIRSEKDEEIDNIKQDLIELGEISMKEEGTFSGRHFHFFVRRIADLMKMNKLDKEYVISLTEKLLIRFESEHHESSLISWFLVAASLYIDSLKAEVQKWLINFICDENRNIYEWQEMWALDTIRQIGKI